MSAAQATGAAIKALTAAKTVRITGTFADPETHHSGQLHMWVTGTSGRGTMGEQGAKIETVFCDGMVYFKASADALKMMTQGQGIPAGAMDLMAGRWFKVGSVQESQLPVLTISGHDRQLPRRLQALHRGHRPGPPASPGHARQPLPLQRLRRPGDGHASARRAGCRPDGSVTMWRRRRESNPCTGLCRPLPKPLGHSAAGASFAGG
jgi:hypothetical protein